MSDFAVTGADQFLRLSKAMKNAARNDLRRQLNKGLSSAAKPLIAKTREEARNTLPKGGGLNEVVAKSPQKVQVRTGAKTAGVRIVVPRTNSGAQGANRGGVRHPVFGNRNVWTTTKVPSGWFDRPLEEGAPIVRPFLEQALQDMADKIVREARG